MQNDPSGIGTIRPISANRDTADNRAILVDFNGTVGFCTHPKLITGLECDRSIATVLDPGSPIVAGPNLDSTAVGLVLGFEQVALTGILGLEYQIDLR
jgi:hypothetical protein